MSFQYEYSFEKFGLAFDELMTTGDHLRTRLLRALNHISGVCDHDVPENLHKEFYCIEKQLQSGIPHNREGYLQATINQISEEEMNKLIDDIVNFNQQLIWWLRDNPGRL